MPHRIYDITMSHQQKTINELCRKHFRVSYTETFLRNTRQRLYIDHFYHEVFGCMKFELMLDLHDWNMQSAQNATSEMQCHNKQQLYHFRSDTSKRIMLELYDTKMNFVEIANGYL